MTTLDDHIDYVVDQVSSIFSSVEIREVVIDRATEIDLKMEDVWERLGEVEIQAIVRKAIHAALCRVVIIQVKSDGIISSQELKFADRILTPLLIDFTDRNPHLPTSITDRGDLMALEKALKNSPRSLFSADGLGGRLSSFPMFCSLCDPFVETPLLPVFMDLVRKLCVLTANVDGISAPEEKVILDFDRLNERCERIATELQNQIQTAPLASENDVSTSAEVRAELRRVKKEVAASRRRLGGTYRHLRKISARIGDNRRRNSLYFGDAWSVQSCAMIVSCLIASAGIGFIIADFSNSIILGILSGITAGLVGTRIVFSEALLNLSWHSTPVLESKQKSIRLERYLLWKQLPLKQSEENRLQRVFDQIADEKLEQDRIAHERAAVSSSMRQSEAQHAPVGMRLVCPGCGQTYRVRSAASRCPSCGTVPTSDDAAEQAVFYLIGWLFALAMFILFSAMSGKDIKW